MKTPSPFYPIPLRDLVVAQKGSKPATLSRKPFAGSMPYLDINALETGEATQYTHKDLAPTATDQDLLVVWDGSRSGLVFKGREGAIGSTLMCLKLVGVTQDYLYYFLKSKFDLINQNTSGSGIPHVDAELFFNLEVPYTTLSKQQEIVHGLVKKLTQGSSLLEHQHTLTKDALSVAKVEFAYDKDNVASSIETFKQSVIASALSGNLTASWRAKHKASKSSGQALGLPEGELRRTSDQHPNWHIPPTWRFVRVQDLASRIQYGTSSKSYAQGTTPVLGMGNIKDGRVTFEKLKYSSDVVEIEKFRLLKGDVLFNRTNSPELVGKTAVFDADTEAIFAGYIIRIQPIPAINPYFLSYCLNSPFAKDYNKSIMVGSASQANINSEKLGDFLVPVPPLEEQAVIVKLVESILAVADDTAASHETAIHDVEQLEKSVLTQAFVLPEEESATHLDAFSRVTRSLAKERADVEMRIKSFNDKIRSNNKSLTLKMKGKQSILDLLRDSPDGSISVDDAWLKSEYYKLWEADGYDRFFKEIEHNLKNNIIEVIRSKENTTVTLVLRENAS
jgi:type I restriction enzyme S subunit